MRKHFFLLAAMLIGTAMFATTYTAVGTPAALFGTEWDPTNSTNDLINIQNTGHNFILNVENVTLAAGEVMFKICEDHAWNTAYPDQDYVANIAENGVYTIAISFDSESKEVGFRAVKSTDNDSDVEPVEIKNGKCGDNLTWALSQDYTLAITGEGPMYEYNWDSPWYDYKDSIKSVIVGEGVTTIGATAFRDCRHMQQCSLPSTLQSIGNEAFCFCFQLISVDIPQSCTSISGWGAFNLVPNLNIQDESIAIESGARSINGYVEGLFVYDNSEKHSLRACSSAAKGEITLDDAIERIEYMAFAQCEDITHINFGSNLKYIGEWSLDGCRGLDGLQFQEGLTEIATHGFGNCFGLRYVSLPNSLTTLGDFAIGNCPDLRVIRLGDSLKYVGYQIFDYCQSIDTIYASMPTPPVLDETAFASTDLSNVICIVPNQSVSLYKNALVWKQMNIKSIDNPEPCTIASGSCGDNLTWKLTCDSILTIEGSGAMTSHPWEAYLSGIAYVNMPYGLTSIGHHAFAYCRNLTSVEIPNSVTCIEGWAFSACSGLTSLTIPNSVDSIGYSAFSSCNNLESVTINNGFICDNGGRYLFDECSSLTTVVWNARTSLDYTGFAFSPFSVILEQITSFTFGDNVEHIPACLCYGMKNLISVNIPNSVTSIGTSAFRSSGIRSIEIPDGVTCIKSSTFNNCHELTSVTIGNGVTLIEQDAFSFCDNLTTLVIPDRVDSIGKSAFGWVPNVEYHGSASGSPWNASWVNGYVENNLVYTDESKKELVACPSWISGDIVLPNTITTITRRAFYNCKGLTSVEIPNGVTDISENAFNKCNSLTSIHIPSSVSFIHCSAFGDCEAISTITVDNGNPIYDSRNNCNAIINTGNNALIKGCKNTIIPDKIKLIAERAFDGCRYLTTINIPDSVTTIGYAAFSGCAGLTSVTIPGNVALIADHAFSGCNGLSSVVIGKKVLTIGSSAFWACSNITTITSLATIPPTIGNNHTFYSIDKSIPLYVPAESVELYRSADYWKEFINILPFWNPDDPVNPGNYELRLLVNEETMGNVTGEGLYAQGTEVTITAIPVEGCRFVRWSDGNTDAERSITLMVDTTFTAYFEPISITLNLEAATEQITGRWFAFGVPFDVAVSTGIFIVGTDDPAMCNYDFVIDEYDGALRASTQNGWKRVAANDTLRPGRFYMIAPKTAREWRFEAANPGEFSEENSVSVNAYPSPYGERHSGWNGIANPQWAATTAEMDGVTYATVYNNYYGVYSTELLCEKEWSRAEPFFVQTPNDGEVVFYAENIPSPSAAPMRMEFTSDKNVSYTLELSDVSFNYTDKAYISTAEGKEDRYMIGRDLEKMQVNNAVVPQLWLEAYGTRLAAYEVPIVKEETYIPIGLYAPQEGTYALTVNDVPEVATIYLTKDGQPIWNVSDGTYALTLEKGDNEGYGLSVNSNKMPTGINSIEASDDIRKMLIDGQILILRGEKTYTITGQKLR